MASCQKLISKAAGNSSASNKRQAASNKQQATSNKQQATSLTRLNYNVIVSYKLKEKS